MGENMSGMPENNQYEFPNPAQKKMLRGAGIGAGFLGAGGVLLSLTSLFSQLAGPLSLQRTAAIALPFVVTGSFLGVLFTEPKDGNTIPGSGADQKPPAL
jgi:hypothetical protein